MAKKTGYNGCFSHLTTGLFLKKLDDIKPDLIHFHNLHNCYINLPMLFNYIKKRNIPVVWTLHDCWPYTGHCPYYDYVNCSKWESTCQECPQIKGYPYSDVDRTKEMFQKKKEWFTGANITIVTPSEWLGSEVKRSFLAEYPVKVINNGIDLNIFAPTDSEFKKVHNIENNFMILGVASAWAPRKGLDVFVKLAETLPDEYAIVIVGIGEKEKDNLPANVVCITHTNNQKELAEIYSAADIFVNPTREENFPTTNIEALACGTGVITYKTGGSPEIIDEETGIVVEKDDYEALKQEIFRVKKENLFRKEKCRNDLAIICYGQNDRTDGFSTNYESIIRTIRTKYPDCSIISILESSQREYTEKMTTIQSICEHYGIPVADTIDAFNNSGKAYDDLSSDGVHPNDAGQEIYFETVKAVIDDNVAASTGKMKDTDVINVVNELDVPILCMGLKDVVVSASPEGILVSDKEQSSYIKPYVNTLDHRVMFAEKSWGSFKVIDIDKASMAIKVTLNAGHQMNYHSHQHRDEVWTVIAGKGKTIVDGMEQNVKAGDVITMSAGCRHTVIAETELKLIEVQLGEAIDVHDKQKFELEY